MLQGQYSTEWPVMTPFDNSGAGGLTVTMTTELLTGMASTDSGGPSGATGNGEGGGERGRGRGGEGEEGRMDVLNNC